MRQQKRQLLKHIDVFCVIVFYNVAINANLAFAITLLPLTVDQLEMSNVTLKCQNEGSQFVKWIYNTKEASIELKDGACKTYPNFLTDNPNLYSYSCTNNEFILILKNISRLNHNDVWRCQIYDGTNFPISNSISIRVKVPLTTLMIGPYNNHITEKENVSIFLQCTTSVCRPKPKFRWYKDKIEMTDEDAVLLSETPNDDAPASSIQLYNNAYSIKLTRELNGWYLFCAADNQNSSFVMSNKIFLNVTYPPNGPPGISNFASKGEFRVLQNDFVRLECSIPGGNPLPRLEWDKYNESPQLVNGNTVTKPTSWQATGRDPVDLTCQSFHIYRNDYVYITINIQYPPDKPEISIETSSGIYVYVDKTISVIEGHTFKLTCSAKSNPPVSLFKWNDIKTDLSNVYTARVDRHVQSISCYVSNEMQFSDSRTTMTGYNITRLYVNVLYPPVVNKMPNRTGYEGDDVIYQCNFELGNPSVTNVTWSWNGTTWNDHLLTISNVSRHHEGVYRCDVQNFMVSSEGTKAFGNASGEFYLSVQSAKIASFSPPSSNVSVFAGIAAGTVGGVLFMAALIVVFIFYRTRKRLSYQKREMSIQYYNCNDSNVNGCISTNADNANAYEAFQHTGSDRQYDSLSPEDSKTETSFDQQYETISPSACNLDIEKQKVYENLQL